MRRLCLTVSVALVLILAWLCSPTPPHPIHASDGQQIDLVPPEVDKKGHPKLDSKLNRKLVEREKRKPATPGKDVIPQVADEQVRVIIECEASQLSAVNADAVGLGGLSEGSYQNLLQVSLPLPALKALADKPGVRFISEPEPPVPLTTSEGVSVINATQWQAAGFTGAGVKVGILDGGFANYTTRQSEGELPASLSTWWAPSIGNQGTSVHGTACAEIIYDIAPNATFYLANFGTTVEMGNAVNWFISQGVNVVSCSMVYFNTGPGNGTGTVCDIVNNARANGITWLQSMGNYAQRHWQGTFVSNDGDNWHEFVAGVDETNGISADTGDTIKVSLMWNDTWGASSNNYNLYLINSALTQILAGSEDVQDGNDDPTEFLSYVATYTGTYYIAIYRYNAAAAVNFHLYSLYDNLQYQVPASSFVSPSDATGAVPIGAFNYSTPTTIENFSSRGPTMDARTIPALVAPDGVSTRAYSPGAFYGTSAAAPHAAGAAVLVKQRFPTYTPAQIQAFLEGRAVDLGDGGKDNIYGSGRLNLGILASTNAATSIASSAATLNGNLLSLGTASTVNVSFEYGLTDSYGSTTTPEAKTATGTFNANITSLTSGTLYHFRAKADGGASGVDYGSDLTFTTLAPPSVTTLAATSVTTNSATLNGDLTSLGSSSTVYVRFYYGTAEPLSSYTDVQTKTSTGTFSASITGLSSNTTYKFKPSANGSGMIRWGDTLTFTTAP